MHAPRIEIDRINPVEVRVRVFRGKKVVLDRTICAEPYEFTTYAEGLRLIEQELNGQGEKHEVAR
jgi:hypothetical protein